MDKAPELGRERSRGKPCKGFMHNRDSTDLIFREFIRPFKIIDLNFPLVRACWISAVSTSPDEIAVKS